MAADLKRLQTSLVRHFYIALSLIILSWIQLCWWDGNPTYLIVPIFLLCVLIDQVLTFIFESRFAMLTEAAALETRLAVLETELKELKAKKTSAGPLEGIPV